MGVMPCGQRSKVILPKPDKDDDYDDNHYCTADGEEAGHIGDAYSDAGLYPDPFSAILE